MFGKALPETQRLSLYERMASAMPDNILLVARLVMGGKILEKEFSFKNVFIFI